MLQRFNALPMLYPLTFRPIFKERVWGGRNLERLYGKRLPPNVPIGESWEISDRPGDVSVIANGPLAGKDLHWLMEHHAKELLGGARPAGERFPLLVKILDAEEKLSLQVHPPAHRAAELGGEPKTEMWYIADAKPDAELYVGLKRGVTRQEFERKIETGEVAECFHKVRVKAGDIMFLPSGRVHAIGAGLVIFEIQQNSDTTYRVFDWNRVGLDGKRRDLHIPESLASVDFEDFEPSHISGALSKELSSGKPLVDCPFFKVNVQRTGAGERIHFSGGKLRIIGLVSGRAAMSDGKAEVVIEAGEFCLVPAGLNGTEATFEAESAFLDIGLGG
jgi:mannose-6-phosphate isomerase